MATIKSQDVALLTGAGFTKSFGGYLASEMWAKIFNHPQIQCNEELRKCMLSQVNFELAYAAVMETANYLDHEKKAFTEAVRSAFASMHKNFTEPSRAGNWPGVEGVINLFCGNENRPGMFFTLNQDVLVETGLATTDGKSSFEIPGIDKKLWYGANLSSWAFRNYGRRHREHGFFLEEVDEDPILLPHQEAIQNIRPHPLLYLKLHGSYGWRKADGSDAMVIGNLKTKAIADEPLLRWYHDLFKESLLNDVKKLVIIGYGFGDTHINRAIAEGVRKSNLRVYVVNKLDVASFKDHLMRLPSEQEVWGAFGDFIWEGLGGYHQGTVCDFYNATGWLTNEGKTFLGSCGLREPH